MRAGKCPSSWVSHTSKVSGRVRPGSGWTQHLSLWLEPGCARNGHASCLEAGSISHPPPHTAAMESPAWAQSFLAWSPSSGQAAGFLQLAWQESTLEVEGGDPGSCCPTATPRVQSMGQRDFMEKTVCMTGGVSPRAPDYSPPDQGQHYVSLLCCNVPLPCQSGHMACRGKHSLPGLERQLYH